MMKTKGKTYDYSMLKVFLPDVTFHQLETLTKTMHTPNNAHTLVIMINEWYNQFIQSKQVVIEDDDKGPKEVGKESS